MTFCPSVFLPYIWFMQTADRSAGTLPSTSPRRPTRTRRSRLPHHTWASPRARLGGSSSALPLCLQWRSPPPSSACDNVANGQPHPPACLSSTSSRTSRCWYRLHRPRRRPHALSPTTPSSSGGSRSASRVASTSSCRTVMRRALRPRDTRVYRSNRRAVSQGVAMYPKVIFVIQVYYI
jgi:hypothetical protein